MSSLSMSDTKINKLNPKLAVREIAELAALAAIMVGCKEAMDILPNIHLTTMFIILGAMLYGWKVLYPVAIFVFAEGLIWGFGTWFVMYLYTWPLCAIVACIFRNERGRLFWTAFAAIQGLTFGALTSITNAVLSGSNSFFAVWVSTWVAGIPFDFIHGVSNAVVTFFLLMPLYKVVTKINKQ